MSDNPFSEPGDNDRTVIRPTPGGRRPTPAARPPNPPRSLPPADPSAPPAVSVSPLTIAASPLLQLLERLRAVRRPPEVQALRERVMQDLSAFERKGRELGMGMELLRPAHYALCASIDDVVLNTPWGAASSWGSQTLVAALHPGARGTDQFFDQLLRLLERPGRLLPLVELMSLCLSLGFMGRYRTGRGGGELDQIRTRAHAAITSLRGKPEPGLSRRWRGVAAPHQPGRRGVPVWVAMAAALALSGGLLFWTSVRLSAASDGLQAQALAAPPAHMPRLTRAALVQPVPPPPEPSALDRLRTALHAESEQGLLSVVGTPAVPVIRIPDRLLFAAGAAVVLPSAQPLIERIGVVLRGERGSVQVLDYADNQPVHTVRFPSSFRLSAARADAVQAVLGRTILNPTRVSAEGRADAEPIAANGTPEGREQNRRVEIVLHRQD
ncbi:MAG TPA: type IVB secretion system protein IcmH/DotU [Acetobacteraceae bacterium]|nr:type IVB secretion system protein IcmH/DotU [Acetobacteraceae bacterium]